MTVQPIVQTDNGNDGIIISNTTALGNADTSQPFVVPACINVYVVVEGTLGGATPTLQMSLDGGTTYYSVPNVSLAAVNTPVQFIPPGGALMRFSTTGGSGTALTFYVGYNKAYS